MMLSSKFSPLVILFVVAGLVACDDPAGVGLDLIDEEGGAPASTAETLDLETFREATISGGTANVLIGQVQDPVLNQDITAHGHINFFPPEEDEFEEGDEVEGVTLRMNPNVHYGDTTGTIDVAVRMILDEWEAVGTTSDTSLVVGDVIGQFTIDVTEDQAQIELPDNWVQQHGDALLDTALVDQFYGFKLEALSGNSVVSIESNTTTLLLQTTGDEDVMLTATPEFSHTALEGGEPAMEDRYVLQNATGYGAYASVLIADTLVNHSVNRATLELPVDTMSFGAHNGSFLRPEVQNVFVELSTEANSTVVTLRQSADNPELFTSQGDVATMRQFFQQTIREADTVDSVAVRIFSDQYYHTLFPEGVPTQPFQLRLAALPVFAPGAPDCPYTKCTPRLLLTTTPID